MPLSMAGHGFSGLAAAVLLPARAAGGIFPTPAFDNRVEDPRPVIGAADWDIAETVTIGIRRSEFNRGAVFGMAGTPIVGP